MFGSNEYPPPAFYFKVVLTATLGMADTSFQDVSGIGAKLDVEEYVEGGENRFVHRLPRSVKHPNLVLKRGIAKLTSPLVHWCKSTLEADFIDPISPMPIIVRLMNEDKAPLRSWLFDNAYPINWEVEEFKSTKNEVAIEKIELSYNSSSRIL